MSTLTFGRITSYAYFPQIPAQQTTKLCSNTPVSLTSVDALTTDNKHDEVGVFEVFQITVQVYKLYAENLK